MLCKIVSLNDIGLDYDFGINGDLNSGIFRLSFDLFEFSMIDHWSLPLFNLGNGDIANNLALGARRYSQFEKMFKDSIDASNSNQFFLFPMGVDLYGYFKFDMTSYSSNDKGNYYKGPCVIFLNFKPIENDCPLLITIGHWIWYSEKNEKPTIDFERPWKELFFKHHGIKEINHDARSIFTTSSGCCTLQ